LLIRYVVENKNPAQDSGRVTSPDSRGEGVMAAEIDILTSRDTAEQVVAIMGPEKILAKLGGGSDRAKAIEVVYRGLQADAGRRGSVMRVTFDHPDIEIVQPVLAQAIEVYLKKHSEIHTGGAFDQFLTQETDQLRSQLLSTDEELRKIKAKVGVMSLEESKKAYADQIASFRQQIFSAEAELAERQAAVAEMARALNIPLFTNAPGVSVVSPTLTNQAAAVLDTTQAVASVQEQPAVSPEKIAAYRKVCALVDTHYKREQDLLLQFTAESSRVKSVHEQLVAAEKQKLQMEAEDPGLLAVQISTSKSPEVDPNLKAREALMTESARVISSLTKIKILTEQLDKIRKEASGVFDAEGSITELQMRRDQQESKYKAFYASLEQSRINERFENGKVSNISRIEAPTPPYRDVGKLNKIRLMLLVGAFAAALALAFLLEFYIDPSVKRPSDIEVGVGLPLFISIPALKLNGSGNHLSNSKAKALLDGPIARRKAITNTEDGGPSPEANGAPDSLHPSALPPTEIVPWDPRHQMRPFAEALRDRLITFFEVNNMTHKPKLVAVTSCSEGAGVSTVAAGLAAALSETGEGNVLLVDMNQQEGSARQFHKGDLAYDLDHALEMNQRDNTKVQDNLFVVSEDTQGDQLPGALPRRFKNLVPKLKASDYDYIIFDMPPISHVSITPRLARFMDMTLVVAEAEKTSKDVVKKAGALIAESRTHVGVVLNKSRSYVPKGLIQEL
jgi:Mrp family chromosome partitioning ATPase